MTSLEKLKTWSPEAINLYFNLSSDEELAAFCDNRLLAEKLRRTVELSNGLIKDIAKALILEAAKRLENVEYYSR